MLRNLKLRFFSVSMKLIILYTTIIIVFAFAFFMTYYLYKVEIDDKLKKVNEEYFSNKISYIESTFKDIKNNAYELRNYIKVKKTESGSDFLDKFDQINRLTRIINYYNYLDDVFVYDASTGYFISTQGSMDIDVYFRKSYFEDKVANKWNDWANNKEDTIINITKYPEDELANRNDYFKRLLYVDIDYLRNSNIIIGFIVDIEKVIRNENYKNADINNFFVIKNDDGKALQDFLYNTLNYYVKESSLKNDGTMNFLEIENNRVFYQLDTQKQLIYLNSVNMKKYYSRLGYYNVIPIIILSSLLFLAVIVSSGFLIRIYKNLRSINSFIEGSFVNNILRKESGTNFMADVKAFIGLSGIKQINVIMLDTRIKSIGEYEIDKFSYDKEFHLFLAENGVRFKSFHFPKSRKIYIVDTKSIKNYRAILEAMQEHLDRYAGNWEQVRINLFVSGIFDDKDGIERAIDEVVSLSENSPVQVNNRVVVAEKANSVEYKYMPGELKNIIRNSMACGDKKAVLDSIGDILKNNIDSGISLSNFKIVVSKINNIIIEVIFERFTEYYDEAVICVNDINHLVDEVDPEYIIFFYGELMEKIDIAAPAETNKEKDKLQQCFISYIEENFSQDIYLETMAEHFNLSAKYLSSKFKEITGYNFTDYLKRYRINAAKEMLRNTCQKVNEISEKVGYNNVNVFIRQFKSIEGITPKAYREIDG